MAPARISRFEHELASGERASRAAVAPLAPLLSQGLIGYRHEQVGFCSWLEPPRPEVTLMVDLEASISADGERLPAAWIGGLGGDYTIVGVGRRYGAIDLKLDPVTAYSVLGAPLSSLGGECVALEDALGRHGRALTDGLREAAGWDARFDVLERWLLTRLADCPVADPVVARAFARLAETEGRLRVGALCSELGVSPRHLSRRFGEQVGLAPKTVARQLRFAAVRRALGRPRPAGSVSWASLAVAAGYADQAHLARDFRELAGITPTDFLARRIPDGGLVGDGV